MGTGGGRVHTGTGFPARIQHQLPDFYIFHTTTCLVEFHRSSRPGLEFEVVDVPAMLEERHPGVESDLTVTAVRVGFVLDFEWS